MFAALALSRTPSLVFPEMRLVSPGFVPPIVFPLEESRMPPAPFAIAAVPVRLVPIRLPWMTWPPELAAAQMPSSLLPEIRLLRMTLPFE